jgi:hypothetical protein
MFLTCAIPTAQSLFDFSGGYLKTHICKAVFILSESELVHCKKSFP